MNDSIISKEKNGDGSEHNARAFIMGKTRGIQAASSFSPPSSLIFTSPLPSFPNPLEFYLSSLCPLPLYSHVVHIFLVPFIVSLLLILSPSSPLACFFSLSHNYCFRPFHAARSIFFPSLPRFSLCFFSC